MKSRYAAGLVYFLSVAFTLLLRISGSLWFYDLPGYENFFTLVGQILCFGVLSVAGYFIVGKQCRFDQIKPLCDEFNFKKCSLRNFGLTLAIAVPVVFLNFLVASVWANLVVLIGYVYPSPEAHDVTVATFFADVALTAVLPGIFEEISHRGLLFAGYRDSGSKVVVVSALLFALMHQNIAQTGYTFFLGLILAATVYYTGSILPAIFLHFFNNFVSVVMDYKTLNPLFGAFAAADNWLYSTTGGTVVLILGALASAGILAVCLDAMRKRAVHDGMIPQGARERAAVGALPLRKDVLLWITVAMGVAATVFSWMWRS